MKKILTVLVILFAVGCGQYASACSQTAGSITGGACSVKELRNLENNQTLDKMNIWNLEPERAVKDLRPIRNKVETPKTDERKCLFGMCLYKTLLGE